MMLDALILLSILAGIGFTRAAHLRSELQAERTKHRVTIGALVTSIRLIAEYEPDDATYPRMIRDLEREIAAR